MLHTFKLLLPALIPSWRFFDIITPSPRIEFSLLSNEAEIPDVWLEFRPRPTKLSFRQIIKSLFWNPSWNESLFVVSCAERIMESPNDHSVEEIFHRIKAHLTRQSIDDSHFQFRLVFVSREENELRNTVTYVSPVHLGGPA